MADQVANEVTSWSENDDLVDKDSSQNTKLIICQFCGSKVLQEKTCSFTEKSVRKFYVEERSY